MTPSKEEMEQNQTASFACFAIGFSPKPYAIKWMRKQSDKDAGVQPKYEINTSYESGKVDEAPLYSAVSYLQVKDADWVDARTEFTCMFEHKAGNLSKSVKYSSSNSKYNSSMCHLSV